MNEVAEATGATPKKFDAIFAAAEASLASRRAALARRRDKLRLLPMTEIIDAERHVALAEAALDREAASLKKVRKQAEEHGTATAAGG